MNNPYVPRPVPVTAARRAAQPPPPRIPEKHWTVKDIATELNVSKMTIYRLIERGDLGAKRIGRSVRVAASDLERYLKATS